MATSPFPDPLQFWRDAVTKLEKDVNSLATGGTESQEVVRSLHGFSTAALGLQQIVDKAISAYLRQANLPSRQEVMELAETLQRIEDKLDRLLPADATAQAPRPARTRRPPVVADGSVATPAAEPVTSAEPPAEPSAKPSAKPPAKPPAKRRTAGRTPPRPPRRAKD